MIEFVTLFLGGLIVGSHPVELMVDAGAAAVELRLDGVAILRLEGAPWRASVDFGAELSPHLLEAVAFDAADDEIDRASQWINMSSREADASLVLDLGEKGQGAVARLTWESLTGQGAPLSVTAHFDEELLEVDDPKSIGLPAFDPEQVHHLRVELEFAASVRSRAEATFGGVYGDEVSTELTAVPIVVEAGRLPQSAADLAGRFLVDEQPVEVRSLEKEVAEIVVVKDLSVQTELDKLGISRRSTRRDIDSLASRSAATAVPVKQDHRLRFLGTCSETLYRKRSRFMVFPRSNELTREHGGLIHIFRLGHPLHCDAERQKLAEAVAVAGLAASKSGRRRTVVLITGSRPVDHSALSPQQVRGYLRRLHVPLEVWSPEKGVDEVHSWGPAVDISSRTRLSRAYKRLAQRLERQRIVWLGGLHLPQAIRLDPETTTVRLVD